MYSIVSVCLKTSIFQTLRVSNSRALRIKNAKFTGDCFYMNTNMHGDFQTCVSVPLNKCSFIKCTCGITTYVNFVSLIIN